MNTRDGIMDALVDEGESIVQIDKYLKHLGINISRTNLIKEVLLLYQQELIMVEYPHELINSKLNVQNIEEYWFRLTAKGYSEWEKIQI